MMVKNQAIVRLIKSLIPEDWTVDILGNISDVRDGTHDSPKYVKNGYPLITSKNLKPNGLDFNDISNITKEDYDKIKRRSKVDVGDVLFGMIGTIGNPIIVKEEDGDFAIKNVALIKFNHNSLYNIYLKHLLDSSLIEKIFQRISNGGVQRFLSLGTIRDLPIPLPPINEQQKIAAILSSVDEAIEKTEQIIEQTETMKKGLMQELLTKGIGHTEFKDTPVGTIPEDWEVLTFNNVFDRITTKNKVDNQNVLTISGEHGLVSQLEYFNRSVSSKSLKNYTYLEKGDFAYNKSYSNGYPLGAIKRLERYDVGVVSTLYICFRLKESYINGFYKYYFDSPYWHRQVYLIAPEGGRSHGLLNVGVRDFFEILIPVPPIKEQEKINNTIYSIDQKIIKENNRLINLNNIKQGLMQQLLTGKKRVKVEDSEEVLS